MAEELFPKFISHPEPLVLLGHGITDMTIETIHVKFTEIGVYFEESIMDHLQVWNGKTVSDILKPKSEFYKHLIESPVIKLIKVVLVKSQKGSQYGSAIETRVRDKLAYEDKYEDDEEEALSNLVEFFQSKKLEPNAYIVYTWPPDNSIVEVSVYHPGSSTPQGGVHKVQDVNVSVAILDWFLGEQCLSESTIESIAGNIV